MVETGVGIEHADSFGVAFRAIHRLPYYRRFSALVKPHYFIAVSLVLIGTYDNSANKSKISVDICRYVGIVINGDTMINHQTNEPVADRLTTLRRVSSRSRGRRAVRGGLGRMMMTICATCGGEGGCPDCEADGANTTKHGRMTAGPYTRKRTMKTKQYSPGPCRQKDYLVIGADGNVVCECDMLDNAAFLALAPELVEALERWYSASDGENDMDAAYVQQCRALTEKLLTRVRGEAVPQ